MTESPVASARTTLADMAPVVRRRALWRSMERRPAADRRKDEALLRRLARAVRVLRYREGVHQNVIATACDCSFKQISNIERAENWPSWALYKKLCAVFGVGVAE